MANNKIEWIPSVHSIPEITLPFITEIFSTDEIYIWGQYLIKLLHMLLLFLIRNHVVLNRVLTYCMA